MLHKYLEVFQVFSTPLHCEVKFTYIYISISCPYNCVGPILPTILMSLIPVAPTQCTTRFRSFFSIQEGIREIRSKNLALINNIITQKLVRDLKVQIMLHRTEPFFTIHCSHNFWLSGIFLHNQDWLITGPERCEMFQGWKYQIAYYCGFWSQINSL